MVGCARAWVGSLALLVVLSGCSDKSGTPREAPGSVALPLVGAPVALGEVALDPPDSYPSSYLESSIIRGESSHLFIWEHGVAGVPHVYGIRYGLDGTRLDAGALPISVQYPSSSKPRGCFNGTHWVVAWVEEYNSVKEVHAARIAQDGTVLDPEGIAINVGVGYLGHPPALGSDGAGNTLIVSARQPGTQAAILDIDGEVAAEFELDAAWSAESAVAFNGTDYLVANPAYQTLSTWDLRARRVSTSGDILDDPAPSIATLGQGPAVGLASDGTDFIVAYATDTQTAFRVVEADGDLGATATRGLNGVLSVTHGSAGYVLAIARNTGIDLSLLSGTGADLGQDSITTNDYPSALSVVPGASDYFLVYEQDPPEPTATPISALGTRLDSGLDAVDDPPIVMNDVANQQEFPRAAFNGSHYLVVWADERDTDLLRDVYGVRVSAEGELLDAQAFLISGATREQWNVDVASNGSDFLVVWEDARDWPIARPMMARVSAEGEVLDPDGVAVDAAVTIGQTPRVASDGSDYFVIWREGASQVAPRDLNGRRVLADTSTPDPKVLISDSIGVAAAALAYNGEQYLVAWDDDGQVFTKATRIAPLDGSVLDTPRIVLPGGEGGEVPDVGSDGSNWLVAWHLNSVSGIRGARVGPTGTVLDGECLVISPDVGKHYRPHVGFDGEQFLVSWYRVLGPSGYTDRQLVAQRVSVDGVVSAGAELLISDQDVIADSSEPALTDGITGTILTTYSRLPAETTVANQRAFARLIVTPATDGSPCELSVTCDSGLCVDGFCTSGSGSGGSGSGGGDGGSSGSDGNDGGTNDGGTSAQGGSGGENIGEPGSGGASDGGTPSAGGDGSGPVSSGGNDPSGEGGSGATRGGTPGAGGISAAGGAKGPSGDDGGCGCKIASRSSAPTFLLWALIPGLALLRRRRR
jgi:hypothetical protein